MNPESRTATANDRRRTLLQRACLGLLRLFGWRALSAPLPGPKGVIIVYPHTSNWDFILGLLYRFGTGLQANWMGKDAIFRWPFRRLMVKMGGVPINRRAASGFIGAAIEQYKTQDWMWLALAPEGTRKHTDHLKSGFYQIAVGADVPCGLGFIDYGTRTLGIQEFVRFSGVVEDDLATLKAFYANKRGRLPDDASEIRFRRQGPT
ncbi:MAG TPA: 1-acyl-sn-glycerol-3-phosphate acyltransferase [Gammaproteobacteria bacterium]|nr:1-acyl-sn-glycerol-3-phosphate acyltransferase [Gammaproteobacteria bacterium]